VVSKVDIYQFEIEEWSTLENSLPTPRAGTFNAVFDGIVYVAGGEDPLEQYAH
jgi:hypothetical protein